MLTTFKKAVTSLSILFRAFSDLLHVFWPIYGSPDGLFQLHN